MKSPLITAGEVSSVSGPNKDGSWKVPTMLSSSWMAARLMAVVTAAEVPVPKEVDTLQLEGLNELMSASYS